MLECGDAAGRRGGGRLQFEPTVSGGNPGYVFTADGLPDG
jgi:hypothetical protein